MHAKDTFSQAQLRLQASGCRYRIKQAPRRPYIQVYDTLPPRRQQAARGFRVDDDQACWDLAALLLKAHERGVQGGPVLIWDELESARAGGPIEGVTSAPLDHPSALLGGFPEGCVDRRGAQQSPVA